MECINIRMLLLEESLFIDYKEKKFDLLITFLKTKL